MGANDSGLRGSSRSHGTDWEGEVPKARRSIAGQPVLGFSESIALPEWGISRLRAKADTGAKTSALHVDAIEELERGRRVRFQVVLHRRRSHRRVTVVARVTRRARVRSSNGHYSVRIFVTTALRIGPIERDVEISLVDREKMIYRMLLGRTALEGLLVDPRHRDLLGDRPRTRRKRSRKVAKRGPAE